jgi:hypothetical protein
MLASVRTLPSYSCSVGGDGVRNGVPRTRRVEGWGGGGKDLNRVFEREKRVASVHRRKSERCLALFLCTGKGQDVRRRSGGGPKHKECGDVGGAQKRGPHTTRLTRN